VVKAGLGDVGGTEIADGNDIAWRQLFDYGELLAADYRNNADLYWTMQGLNPDGTRNPNLPVLLDVDNLITFMSIVIMTGGYDTGISQFLGNNLANNWFGIYNRETADRGFQFFVHDNEHSLGAGSPVHSTLTIDRSGPFNLGNQSNYAQANPQYLHQDLLGHPEYRQQFIDFVQKNFFNDGPLTAANNIARLMERVTQVEPAIIAEAARWGDSKVHPPHNKTTWQNEINWLVNTYFPSRNTHVLAQFRGDGLFTSFNAPTFNQFGGDVPYNFGLTMSASPGMIYYTVDGETDPRLIGGEVNPAATLYTAGIPLTEGVTVKARLLHTSGVWSGLVEATFNVAALPGDFDGNGNVDGRDFLAWQRGGSPTPLSSSDLADWQENYGTVATLVNEELVALSAVDSLPDNFWLMAPQERVEPLTNELNEEAVEELFADDTSLEHTIVRSHQAESWNNISLTGDENEASNLFEFDTVYEQWETIS
jgi:hypothetical protein